MTQATGLHYMCRSGLSFRLSIRQAQSAVDIQVDKLADGIHSEQALFEGLIISTQNSVSFISCIFY